MAVVTTEEAIAFVEHAMRNWDDLRFDTDDLEDLRLALGQFLASHTKPAVTLYCSFCGKSQHEVRVLVAGITAFICNECTDLSHDICHEDAQAIEAGTGETPSGSIRQDESAVRKDAP